MELRPRWSCPDLAPEARRGRLLPIVGQAMRSDGTPAVPFHECPASYLRMAWSGLPTKHLLDDGTHVAHLVSDLVFEVESGSRNMDTVSTKAREGIHLYLAERSSRDRSDSEKRKESHGAKR